MQHTKPTNHGFTLVEVLLIAPMAMLVLATFVYLLSTLVGDVLIQRERNMMTYSLQDAADKIENDIKLAVKFPSATGTLVSPQGVNGGTGAFTSDTALILSTLGTTKRPPDPSRDLSFSQVKDPDLCGTNLQYRNEIIKVTVVYFLNGGKLWRRTIVPTSPLPCPGLEPWQQNSCPVNSTGSICKVSDILVATDISAMTLGYRNTANSAESYSASDATTYATVKLTSTKRVAGRLFTVTNAISAMKLNY